MVVAILKKTIHYFDYFTRFKTSETKQKFEVLVEILQCMKMKIVFVQDSAKILLNRIQLWEDIYNFG